MTIKNDALKLALEALEQYEKAGLSTLKTIDAIVSLRETLAHAPSEREQPAQPIRWDSAAVDMTGAVATLPKTGSESVVDYKFVGGTKVSETRATIEDGVVTSVTITNTAPPYINSTGADANIAGIPGTYYGIVPKGTGKITVTSTPTSKPWVGLDEEEIEKCCFHADSIEDNMETWKWTLLFYEAVATKLREKNT